MTSRQQLRTKVIDALGNRALAWAGIRGDDAEPLTDLPQFEGSFSIVAAYQRRPLTDSVAYEEISGERVDLELWDIDDHLSAEATTQFRRALLRFLSGPSALLPYRPSDFLSAVWFGRRDRCINLGMFGGHQNAFEHKPWVESAIASLGVPGIPWTYIADDDRLEARRFLDGGPVMLRPSRTSGGEGLVKVDTEKALVERWPSGSEAFVSVSQFIDGALPVNIGATVWGSEVTVHHPSVQLIGIPACVTRPFGYCGNDFGRAAQLEPAIIDQIEESTRRIGEWLGRFGYLGTFGVDYLVTEGVPLFTEVNPRFQGSTHASCRLSVEADQPCLMLEHIAATLGLEPPIRPRLRDLAGQTSDLSHVVVHWTGEEPTRLDGRRLATSLAERVSYVSSDVLAHPRVLTHRGAAVARFTTRRSITESGYDLDADWSTAVARWTDQSSTWRGDGDATPVPR